MKRRIALGLISCLAVIMACKSTSSIASNEKPDEETVEFSLSGKNERKFFSSIDPHILELVEIASPQSLKQVYSLLYKSDAETYSEKETVLLTVSYEIMNFVWPSEVVSWNVPPLTSMNVYTGAIESARRGVYDLSTGNSDFLSIMLPSLVLLSSTTKTDFYEQSQKALLKCLESRPNSVLVNYLLGVLYSKKNEHQEALKYFTTCTKYAFSTYEVLYAQAKAFYENENYDACISISERLLQKYPQNLDLLGLCAKSSFNVGNINAAENYVVRVLLLEPENLDYVLFRAKILMKKGDYIRASSLLDVYGKSNTTSKQYLLLKAQLQNEWNKNASQTAETSSIAVALYPEDIEVLTFAAAIGSSLNVRISGLTARQLAEKVLVIEPENLEAKRICITELVKSGEFQKAYDLSSSLITRSEDNANLIYEHIDICLALNKKTEAYNYAVKMYDKNRQDEHAQIAYIKTLAANGQQNAASSLIASLLTSSSSKMKSFLYYQRSFFSSNEDVVLSDLRSSLTANPRNKDSLYRLYQIYYGKKDWRRSQYYLKQVVALDPSNTQYLTLNAELDSLQGK